ncbi:MAG: glutaredoxin family protein [Desulfovibrionaceae bacterium]
MGSIKMYGLSTCIHCKHAKQFLDECEVAYECVFVDTLQGDEKKAMLAEVKKHNPSCSFPTLVIGEKVVVGFHRDDIKEAIDKCKE